LQSNQSIDSDEQTNFTDQDTYIHNWHWGQNAKAGLDYNISPHTTVGVVWTGYWNDFNEDGTARSAFDKGDGVEYLVATTHKTSVTNTTNQIGNLNFLHLFGANGGQLTADFDIGQFSRDFANMLTTETTSIEEPVQPTSGLLSEMPTSVNIRTAKVDYNRTVFSKWKMEAGLKGAYVKTNNDLTLSQGEDDHLVKDEELSNQFAYTEEVYAAYASFSGKLGDKTEMQLGIRAEHTHSVGNSITKNSVVTRNYLDFFPSFFLSQHLSKDHILTVSYSYRIDRPNYQGLNPARLYVDPYLCSRGNPYLLPQYTHSLELKHGFKDKLFTSIGASFVSDFVFYLIQPVDSIRIERTPLNVGNSQSYNLTVSFPLKIANGWNLQMNIMGLYSRFDYVYKDNPIVIEQISGRFNV
jgi:Outer membrane protein beta-barrel family